MIRTPFGCGIRRDFYGDGDGDGYGWPGFFVESCSAPPNMVLNPEDCDDNNRYVSPDATEICDGIDNKIASVLMMTMMS